MTILLTGAGGLYTRAGHLGGILGVGTSLANADINFYRGTTVPAKVTQVLNDYAATPDDRLLVDGIFAQLNGWQQVNGGFLQYIQGLMQQTLIQMANQDTPLASLSVQAAMTLLIEQMAGVATVKRSVPTAGGQAALGTPNGLASIVMSVLDANGLPLQYVFPETLTFTCTADSQSGGAVLGQEPFSVQGAAAASSPLNFTWPAGSGTNLTRLCVDGGVNFPSAGNLLVNSGFETFTIANTPNNWPIAVGVAGTNVFSSSTAYQGLKSLQFTGDGGGTLTAVAQQFNNTLGTSYRLLPSTQYAFKAWVQVPVVPAAGVLAFDLGTLATGGSVIQDNQGVNNLTSVSLLGLTGATWTSVSGVFRTPSVLSANQFFRIRLTTAIDSAKVVLIDRLAFTPMVPLYTGGPASAIFSTAQMLLVNDAWTVAIGNTPGLFQLLFEKVFGMRALGMVLPNAASPSISDSLIA